VPLRRALMPLEAGEFRAEGGVRPPSRTSACGGRSATYGRHAGRTLRRVLAGRSRSRFGRDGRQSGNGRQFGLSAFRVMRGRDGVVNEEVGLQPCAGMGFGSGSIGNGVDDLLHDDFKALVRAGCHSISERG